MVLFIHGTVVCGCGLRHDYRCARRGPMVVLASTFKCACGIVQSAETTTMEVSDELLSSVYNCIAKVPFRSRSKAKKVAIQWHSKDPNHKASEPYLCPYCDQWHLTRKEKT